MGVRDGWDWGMRPNLSKLPLHLRESLTETIPLRPGEVYGKVLIFNKTTGLNHPNGRILVTNYHKDAARPVGPPDGAQIDMVDFSGRLPLATCLLRKKQVPDILRGLMRSFLAMGGTVEELHSAIDTAAKPELLHNPLLPKATDE